MIKSNRNFVVIRNPISYVPQYKSNVIFISEKLTYDTQEYLYYLSNVYEYVIYVPYYKVPFEIYVSNIITLIDSKVEIDYCIFYACQNSSSYSIETTILNEKEKRMYIIDKDNLSMKPLHIQYYTPNYITAVISQEGSFKTPAGPNYDKISWHKNIDYLLSDNTPKSLIQAKLDGCRYEFEKSAEQTRSCKAYTLLQQKLLKQISLLETM